MTDIMNIHGVDCYEQDGTAYLRLETVARGLGFTQEKNGAAYIRWDRVDQYLEDFGFPHKWGKNVPCLEASCEGREPGNTFGTSAERPEFIPENIFYRLAMKAKNETAERFQALVADEIIPSIRKTGQYKAPGAPHSVLEDMDAKQVVRFTSALSACPARRWPYMLEALRQMGVDLGKVAEPEKPEPEPQPGAVPWYSKRRGHLPDTIKLPNMDKYDISDVPPEERDDLRDTAMRMLRTVRKAGVTFANMGEPLGCDRGPMSRYLASGNRPSVKKSMQIIATYPVAFPEIFNKTGGN